MCRVLARTQRMCCLCFRGPRRVQKLFNILCGISVPQDEADGSRWFWWSQEYCAEAEGFLNHSRNWDIMQQVLLTSLCWMEHDRWACKCGCLVPISDRKWNVDHTPSCHRVSVRPTLWTGAQSTQAHAAFFGIFLLFLIRGFHISWSLSFRNEPETLRYIVFVFLALSL